MNLIENCEVNESLFLHEKFEGHFNENNISDAGRERYEQAVQSTRSYLVDLMSTEDLTRQGLEVAGINQFAIEMDRQKFPAIKQSYAEEKVQAIVNEIMPDQMA